MQVDAKDAGLIPRLERSPGRRHGNPLQHSCLENPVDRGAWWATVHRVTELDTTEVTARTQRGWSRKKEPDSQRHGLSF